VQGIKIVWYSTLSCEEGVGREHRKTVVIKSPEVISNNVIKTGKYLISKNNLLVMVNCQESAVIGENEVLRLRPK